MKMVVGSGLFESFVVLVLSAALADGCGTKRTKDSPLGGSIGTGGSAGTSAPEAGTTGSAGAGGLGGAAGAHIDAGSDAPIVGAFATQALAIAGEYPSWGRVDDELRWAPGLCRQPLPGIARPSQSNDSATHGQKLYSVFVKNHAAYPTGPQTDQAVVKESWVPELVTGPDAAYDPGSYRAPADAGDHFYAYAKGDGGVYRASAPAGLFIMFRLDTTTPETDEGWVYATVSTAGQVTSAGRVASCMGCHEVAEHERLFGVPTSPAF